jgi:DNA replication protein DnaC
LTQSSNPEKTLELKRDFLKVELTQEEHDEALRQARETKHYHLKKIAYLEKLNAPKVFKSFTAEEIFDLLKSDGTDEIGNVISKGLIIDKDNEEVVRLLTYYFSGDERFELEGFDLKKGIILFGGVGVGKTTLMRRFVNNQVQSFKMIMCRAVEDMFSQEGDKTLVEYSHPQQISVNGNPFGHQYLGICFDDLGTEPESKYYGKATNVMAEIILNRYDNDLPRNMTHITTNLDTKQIFARYGSRVTDRMTEMFNLIGFGKDTPSRRK